MKCDNPNQTWLRLTTTALLVLSLSACGFQLRGSYNMPELLNGLNIQAPKHSTLQDELELALETNKVPLHGGELSLVIIDEDLTRQTATVDSSAKAAEYTLVYEVRYQLRYHDGMPATEPRTLLLRRSYQYDTTSIVGKNTEEEILKQELHNDAVNQIVRQLSALTPENLLPSSPSPKRLNL